MADIKRLISGVKFREIVTRWARYFELAEAIANERSRSKLIKLITEFAIRDKEACKFAQENLCIILEREFKTEDLPEEERCKHCVLADWCVGPFSMQNRIHALVRIGFESPKPYSSETIEKAKRIAEAIHRDKWFYEEVVERAHRW